MSALAQLIAAGVEIEALPDGKLRASGNLTDTTRALIRTYKPEILAELAADDPGIKPLIDPEVARRRAKALALLDDEPSRELAVVAEAGNPAHIAIAFRGGLVGEIEVAADRYDPFKLLELMQQYGCA